MGWLQKEGLLTDRRVVLTESQQSALDELAEVVENTLLAAVRLGSVVIVTNAVSGWVEQSCETFMPSLSALISSFAIISARSRYEQHGIFAPSVWKCRAISDQVMDFSASHLGEQLSVISLGDAVYEQEA